MEQQSRIEFLAKYGIAALLLVILGSILTFAGIIAFQSRQNQCSFDFGITCTNHIITPTGLTLTLQNNLGQDITIVSLKDLKGLCELKNEKLPSGSTEVFTLTKCTHNQTGNYQTNLELVYTTSGGTSRTLSGITKGSIQS